MSDIDALVEFMHRHRNMTVLTGAGCSTGSGIPAYRDEDGNWKNAAPVQYNDFIASAAARKRYWARSFAGWNRVSSAEPNAAHRALARLEQAGPVRSLITQNVDNLHRIAGSRNVIDLHGVLYRTRCMRCGTEGHRSDWQRILERHNPDWLETPAQYGPDGDAVPASPDVLHFHVPDCPYCGGIVKPDVVFFGEAVPAGTVAAALQQLEQSDALLVVGSSLMVFSGYRFARLAKKMELPIGIVNLGRTRADDVASFKLRGDCTDILPRIVDRVAA